MTERNPTFRCALLCLALLSTACALDVPIASQSGMSLAAQVYLSEIIDDMQANSISRLKINWSSFRRDVMATGGTAQTVAETFPAIRKALALLGDGHSSYRAENGTLLFMPTHSCVASSAPSVTGLPANVGYVKVGEFVGSPSEATVFANGIQDRIKLADRNDLIGWIVDLRGNAGGNMWPMVAGLGPVLGDGILGSFVNPLGAQTMWQYRDGASWLGGSAIQRVDVPYILKSPNPKVAVLVDNAVASSGEATFIAFVKRPNTRSFGLATCGMSTANAALLLSDRAVLNVTSAVMVDRAGTKYGDQVPPDESIQDQSLAVQRAVAWLQGTSN